MDERDLKEIERLATNRRISKNEVLRCDFADRLSDRAPALVAAVRQERLLKDEAIARASTAETRVAHLEIEVARLRAEVDRRPNIKAEDARCVRGVTAYCDGSVLPTDAIEAAERVDKALRMHGEKARG